MYAKSHIKNGDILLYSADDILGRTINSLDSSYYSHCGIAFIKDDKLYSYEISGENPLDADKIALHNLDERIKMFKDFCVLRVRGVWQEKIKRVLLEKMAYSNQTYDYVFAFKKVISDYTGDVMTALGKGKDVCSTFVNDYLNKLGIIDYNWKQFLTPQDFLRYQNNTKIETLFVDKI